MNVGSLSVIMCNYNHACYIGDALQAILNQTFMPIEVIVVDDGSTDNSITVIEQFTKRSSIVHLVRNDRNRGVVFSANRALEIASGDYMYFASADDKVLPGLFEKSMNLLAQYPQAGLCCSDTIYFDNSGHIMDVRLRLSDYLSYFTPDELFEFTLRRFVSPICSQTTIMKRSALLEAGGFISELEWSCDWFAHLVIGFRHGFCCIPEPLAAMRTSLNSYSAVGHRNWQAEREIINTMLRLLETPAYSDVRPRFKQTAVFSCYPLKVLRVILSNPKRWNYLSIRLIRHALRPEVRRAFAYIKGAVSPITPTPIKRMYRYIRAMR